MAELLSVEDFVTASEKEVAKILRDGLPADWTVICNKVFIGEGASYELDFLIIGTKAIFVVDDKNWQGILRMDADYWHSSVGFGSVKTPLNKLEKQVEPRMQKHMQKLIPELQGKSYFVKGRVLISGMTALPPAMDIQDPRVNKMVLLRSNVCQALIKSNNKSDRDFDVIGANRAKLRQAFNTFSKAELFTNGKKIGSYIINDVEEGRIGATRITAMLEGPGGGARQLVLYDLNTDPLSERAKQKEFYLKEFAALQRLQQSGLAPHVSDPFEWSDNRFLVLPVHPCPGEALATLPEPQLEAELIADLDLAEKTFRALAKLHEAGVVHRALSPGAIYLKDKTNVRFTDFFAARVGGDGERSTSATRQLSALGLDDPYAAPEIGMGYKYAKPASDVYSLALIWLARLTHFKVDELRSGADGAVKVPGLQAIWSALDSHANEELENLFRDVLEAADAAARPDANTFANRLKRIKELFEFGKNGIDPLLLGSNYHVMQHLGRGQFANTYLAYDTVLRENVAVKQFRQPEKIYQAGAALDEYKTLLDLRSPYIPRVYGIQAADAKDHLKMQYIPGPNLRQLEREFPWEVERWWKLAQGLLNALEALHSVGLLHRDIKPDNIIMSSDENGERAVLVDFGAATKVGKKALFAGTERYSPPEAISSQIPPSSCDLYAVAVILFRALTGYWPYEDTLNRQLSLPSTLTDPRRIMLANVLLQALSNTPPERFSNPEAMREALQNALKAPIIEPVLELEPQINPQVNLIRGVYRNSRIGNKDNRGLDSDFARETYTPTALDTFLLPEILKKRPHAVFLSGNPGDGKTAFLEKIAVALEKQGGVRNENAGIVPTSGWEIQLPDGHIFRSCYDASEAEAGKSADEQLSAKLAGLEGVDEPAAKLTALVAINDGRLAEYFENHRSRLGWLAKQVEAARRAQGDTAAPVWLVDLKKRSFVRLDITADSVAHKVLEKLVEPGKWKICDSCSAKTYCPLTRNARLLREKDTAARLAYLLLVNHLRRQRHTTMRDLRSALAYLITADTGCEEVHAMSGTSSEDKPRHAPVDLAYWRSVFAAVKGGDELLSELVTLDPARFPQPALDRFLHAYRTSDSYAQQKRTALFANSADLDPQEFTSETDRIRAFRRRLFFESQSELNDENLPAVDWKRLLPYRHAALFIELLAGRADNADALVRLAEGIFRSDGEGRLDIPPGSLNIKVKASREQRLVILKQFPLDQFRLKVEEVAGLQEVELIPEALVLEYTKQPGLRLEIGLDLFELLMRLADGLQPDAPEFQPLLEDLVPFKSALLLSESKDLLLVENKNKLHRLTQRDGKIVREAVQRSGEVAR